MEVEENLKHLRNAKYAVWQTAAGIPLSRSLGWVFQRRGIKGVRLSENPSCVSTFFRAIVHVEQLLFRVSAVHRGCFYNVLTNRDMPILEAGHSLFQMYFLAPGKGTRRIKKIHFCSNSVHTF